jgi:Acetylornithine deacetylase/Succinyl-diaminopimelate desuccinylase and related deacylases
MRWYEVTVTGQEAHTGATPMRLRKNALLGAARMIERIDAIALEHAPNAVGAVGLIENKPNSRNVVPAKFSLRSISATRRTRSSTSWRPSCGRRWPSFCRR